MGTIAEGELLRTATSANCYGFFLFYLHGCRVKTAAFVRTVTVRQVPGAATGTVIFCARQLHNDIRFFLFHISSMVGNNILYKQINLAIRIFQRQLRIKLFIALRYSCKSRDNIPGHQPDKPDPGSVPAGQPNIGDVLTIDDAMRCNNDKIVVIIDVKQANKGSNLFMSLERNDSTGTAPRQAIVLNTTSLAKTIVGNSKQCRIEPLGGYH